MLQQTEYVMLLVGYWLVSQLDVLWQNAVSCRLHQTGNKIQYEHGPMDVWIYL